MTAYAFRIRPMAAVGATALLATALLAPADGAGATAASGYAKPKTTYSVADPGALYDPGSKRFVVVGTGARGDLSTSSEAGGPFTHLGQAMRASDVPSWVDASQAFWAPSIIAVGNRFVMFYSAVKRGFADSARCIGSASSSSATGPFVPDATEASRPLVCPGGSQAPDPVHDRPAQRPGFSGADGVIDPSVRYYTVSGTRGLYLTYKTQGTPSSIRLVRLNISTGGESVLGESKQLTTNQGIEENPTIVQRGSTFTLFTSVGGYTGCNYYTHWRNSTNLWSWPQSSSVLGRPASPTTCGTGGADVIPGLPQNSWRIFFAARYPTGSDARYLYVGTLVWDGNTPRIYSLL